VTLILDTGPIVAALNEQDPDHHRCADLLAGVKDLLVPSPVLVEVDYWLIKLGGAKVWGDFVADINRGAYRVAHPTEADLARAAELEQTYEDLDLWLVDACTVALWRWRDDRRHARRATLLSRAPDTTHLTSSQIETQRRSLRHSCPLHRRPSGDIGSAFSIRREVDG
jgi:predicted nucleic acid-binding protein